METLRRGAGDLVRVRLGRLQQIPGERPYCRARAVRSCPAAVQRHWSTAPGLFWQHIAKPDPSHVCHHHFDSASDCRVHEPADLLRVASCQWSYHTQPWRAFAPCTHMGRPRRTWVHVHLLLLLLGRTAFGVCACFTKCPRVLNSIGRTAPSRSAAPQSTWPCVTSLLLVTLACSC